MGSNATRKAFLRATRRATVEQPHDQRNAATAYGAVRRRRNKQRLTNFRLTHYRSWSLFNSP